MKNQPNQALYAILLSILILIIGVGHLSAQKANTLQPPKDQIALQLGAIQMGYEVPFTLTGNISTQKMQQAANALVMGRNALDATIDAPAVKVQGAVNCPSVDSLEYRNQLYSAVEYVVTSPVVATVKGYVKLANNKTVELNTKLTVPPNLWTIPLPYALESRSSADAQELASNVTNLQIQTSGLSSNLTAVQAQVTSVSNNASAALASVQTILSGNVWEWSEDVAYTSYRRIRGGGWGSYAYSAAVAYRDDYHYPDARNGYFGFRLVRSSGN